MKVLVLAALCALATPAHADDGDRFSGGTMALQAGGGTLGLFVGGVVGGALGYAVGTRSPDSWVPLIGAAIGAGIGGVTGLIVGVDLVGDARGSTGSWYGSLAGAVVGGFGAAGLLYVQPTSKAAKTALVVVEVVVFVGATVIGYQLTAAEHAHPAIAVPLVVLAF